MPLRKHLLWALLSIVLLVCPIDLYTQTLFFIFYNAIDDDGDGLIDLNDRDCLCEQMQPISLIPNPSFESKSCCPVSPARMDCVNDWIQASEATTDYIHTCDWMGWPGMPMPLPVPDGQACIGFRNGDYSANRFAPAWKEYMGICLPEPLKAGVSYILKFHVGFSHANISPPTQVELFGSIDCNHLPYGLGVSDFGCPSNGSGLKKLGSANVSGVNQWVETEIRFIPSEPVQTIAIGPPCENAIANNTLFYFLDNLILETEDNFHYEIGLTEHPCHSDVSLSVKPVDSAAYQWYKEGIALINENQSALSHIYGEGVYQMRLSFPNSDCRMTPPYSYQKPLSESFDIITICEGDSYGFNDESITEPGIYVDSLKTKEGCDSVAILDLHIFENRIDTVEVNIFPQETLELGHYRLKEPGGYSLNLYSQSGCDSSVFLILSHYKAYLPSAFTPNGDGINDFFTLTGDTDLRSIEQLTIFNRWGKMVYIGQGLSPNNLSQGWDGKSRGQDMPEGVYVFHAKLDFGQGSPHWVSGSISLIR